MSAYEGIEEVTSARRSQGETVWIKPGKYDLEIVRVKDGKADQGEGRPYFVADFEVVTSTNPDIEVGDQISWMTTRGKFKQYFLQDVKNFIAAATESHPNDVTSDVVSECTSDSQPLVGFLMKADAYNKPSKQGNDFTVVNYKAHRS
mgnify:CR=1 FL=1